MVCVAFADLFVGRVVSGAARVAHGGGEDAGCVREGHLDAPERPAAKHRFFYFHGRWEAAALAFGVFIVEGSDLGSELELGLVPVDGEADRVAIAPGDTRSSSIRVCSVLAAAEKCRDDAQSEGVEDVHVVLRGAFRQSGDRGCRLGVIDRTILDREGSVDASARSPYYAHWFPLVRPKPPMKGMGPGQDSNEVL